jgi:hypothetical protein
MTSAVGPAPDDGVAADGRRQTLGLHIQDNTVVTETSSTRSGAVPLPSHSMHTGTDDVSGWAGRVVFAGITLIRRRRSKVASYMDIETLRTACSAT